MAVEMKFGTKSLPKAIRCPVESLIYRRHKRKDGVGPLDSSKAVRPIKVHELRRQEVRPVGSRTKTSATDVPRTPRSFFHPAIYVKIRISNCLCAFCCRMEFIDRELASTTMSLPSKTDEGVFEGLARSEDDCVTHQNLKSVVTFKGAGVRDIKDYRGASVDQNYDEDMLAGHRVFGRLSSAHDLCYWN